MTEPYLGELRCFGFNYPPRGWAYCQGQLLPIAQNTALFSLLGTMYGGNGQTTFGLPDLRGRAPIGFGQGPGLSPRELGEVGGEEQVTLTAAQIPPHTHTVMGATDASTKSPTNAVPGVTAGGSSYSSTPSTPMNAGMIPPSGGGNQPHDNISPYLATNWCIALEGLYPPRS